VIKLRAGHDVRPGKENFLFSKTSKLPVRPTHPVIQQVIEDPTELCDSMAVGSMIMCDTPLRCSVF